MRIRSIRPEFWSSEDVAAMDWHTRLVYIGLWSYVDDNGVGRDVERLIVTALFPLDDDLSESSVRVHRALKHLEAAGNITRYTVSDKPYLHINAWSKHQKINRPTAGRYPLPTRGNAEPHDALTESSVSPHADATPGEGEKGRRGEGGTTYGREPEAPLDGELEPTGDDPEPSAQTLVGEWLDHCDTRPPKRVIGQVSRELKNLLGEGQNYAHVRAGLAAWSRKGSHPSSLASFVHQQQIPRQPATKAERNLAILDEAEARWARSNQEIA